MIKNWPVHVYVDIVSWLCCGKNDSSSRNQSLYIQSLYISSLDVLMSLYISSIIITFIAEITRSLLGPLQNMPKSRTEKFQSLAPLCKTYIIIRTEHDTGVSDRCQVTFRPLDSAGPFAVALVSALKLSPLQRRFPKTQSQ